MKDFRPVAIQLMLAVLLIPFTLQAAPRSTPVTVVNDAANPVPVTGTVDTNVVGTPGVTIENADPVPVTLTDPITVNPSMTYQYVGDSTVSRPASFGISRLHDECQVDYGSSARMCTSKEVFDTPNLPSPYLGTAWVRPVIASVFWRDSDQYWYFTDITGHQFSTPGVNPGVPGVTASITCNSWQFNNSTQRGTTIASSNNQLYLFTSACNSSHPVACCTPQ